MKIAVIGAGASGLVASIKASWCKDQVIVFEKNSDAGKKLLITGNGRCNYGNLDQDLKRYHSNRPELIASLINEKNLKELDQFFKKIGVIPKIKNNYLYPYSEKSSSIKSALMTEALNNNVEFRYNTEVFNIDALSDGFLINNEKFDKVIIATGSKCAPKTGSTGFGYDIAKKFHHHVIDINPSLMQLVTNTGMEKDWAGKRCEVMVSHFEDGVFKKSELGEIQFTNYGLSGICIFNLSRSLLFKAILTI